MMETKQCYRSKCGLDAEYACHCTSPPTYSCESHLSAHYRLPGRIHQFESLISPYFEESKHALLKFLQKEKLTKDKLKKKAIISYSKSLSISENKFENFLLNLDSEIIEINSCHEKISQCEKSSLLEQDPILKLLSLSPDDAVQKAKEIIQISTNSYKNGKLIWGLSRDIEKMFECYIKDRFKVYLDKLLELEKLIEDYSDKYKNIADNKIVEIKNAVSDLIRNLDKSKKELEEWKQELKSKYKLHSHSRAQGQSSLSEDLKANPSEIQIKIKNRSITQELIDKKNEILSKVNNIDTEREFRNTCALYDYEKNVSASDSSLGKAYQEYIRAYYKANSLYFTRDNFKTTSLVVYNTETEKKEIRPLKDAHLLDLGTCSTLLPDGNLFCFGKANPVSGIALIINEDCEVQMLPSWVSCCNSSVIYFNKNVYCFGGSNNDKDLDLSEMFDLDKNQWKKLQPLPNSDSYCYSVVFNRDILISGYKASHLLKYSISSDTFIKISVNFAPNKQKIIINLERLYLIECGGVVYESETGNENSWKFIAGSIINYDNPVQICCLYNKSAIYIGSNSYEQSEYYKFDLNQKIMIKL